MSYAEPTRCASCEATIADMDIAHLWHANDCRRMMDGFCRCARWSCAACCRDDACTPLAARLRAAHDQQASLGEFPVSSTRGLPKKRTTG